MKKAIDAAPYIDRKANCRNADPDTCIELYKTEIKKIDKKIRSGVPLDEFDPLLERRSLYVQMIHIKKNFFPTTRPGVSPQIRSGSFGKCKNL